MAEEEHNPVMESFYSVESLCDDKSLCDNECSVLHRAQKDSAEVDNYLPNTETSALRDKLEALCSYASDEENVSPEQLPSTKNETATEHIGYGDFYTSFNSQPKKSMPYHKRRLECIESTREKVSAIRTNTADGQNIKYTLPGGKLLKAKYKEPLIEPNETTNKNVYPSEGAFQNDSFDSESRVVSGDFNGSNESTSHFNSSTTLEHDERFDKVSREADDILRQLSVTLHLSKNTENSKAMTNFDSRNDEDPILELEDDDSLNSQENLIEKILSFKQTGKETRFSTAALEDDRSPSPEDICSQTEIMKELTMKKINTLLNTHPLDRPYLDSEAIEEISTYSKVTKIKKQKSEDQRILDEFDRHFELCFDDSTEEDDFVSVDDMQIKQLNSDYSTEQKLYESNNVNGLITSSPSLLLPEEDGKHNIRENAANEEDSHMDRFNIETSVFQPHIPIANNKHTNFQNVLLPAVVTTDDHLHSQSIIFEEEPYTRLRNEHTSAPDIEHRGEDWHMAIDKNKITEPVNIWKAEINLNTGEKYYESQRYASNKRYSDNGEVDSKCSALKSNVRSETQQKVKCASHNQEAYVENYTESDFLEGNVGNTLSVLDSPGVEKHYNKEKRSYKETSRDRFLREVDKEVKKNFINDMYCTDQLKTKMLDNRVGMSLHADSDNLYGEVGRTFKRSHSDVDAANDIETLATNVVDHDISKKRNQNELSLEAPSRRALQNGTCCEFPKHFTQGLSSARKLSLSTDNVKYCKNDSSKFECKAYSRGKRSTPLNTQGINLKRSVSETYLGDIKAQKSEIYNHKATCKKHDKISDRDIRGQVGSERATYNIFDSDTVQSSCSSPIKLEEDVSSIFTVTFEPGTKTITKIVESSDQSLNGFSLRSSICDNETDGMKLHGTVKQLGNISPNVTSYSKQNESVLNNKTHNVMGSNEYLDCMSLGNTLRHKKPQSLITNSDEECSYFNEDTRYCQSSLLSLEKMVKILNSRGHTHASIDSLNKFNGDVVTNSYEYIDSLNCRTPVAPRRRFKSSINVNQGRLETLPLNKFETEKIPCLSCKSGLESSHEVDNDFLGSLSYEYKDTAQQSTAVKADLSCISESKESKIFKPGCGSVTAGMFCQSGSGTSTSADMRLKASGVGCSLVDYSNDIEEPNMKPYPCVISNGMHPGSELERERDVDERTAAIEIRQDNFKQMHLEKNPFHAQNISINSNPLMSFQTSEQNKYTSKISTEPKQSKMVHHGICDVATNFGANIYSSDFDEKKEKTNANIDSDISRRGQFASGFSRENIYTTTKLQSPGAGNPSTFLNKQLDRIESPSFDSEKAVLGNASQNETLTNRLMRRGSHCLLELRNSIIKHGAPIVSGNVFQQNNPIRPSLTSNDIKNDINENSSPSILRKVIQRDQLSEKTTKVQFITSPVHGRILKSEGRPVHLNNESSIECNPIIDVTISANSECFPIHGRKLKLATKGICQPIRATEESHLFSQYCGTQSCDKNGVVDYRTQLVGIGMNKCAKEEFYEDDELSVFTPKQDKVPSSLRKIFKCAFSGRTTAWSNHLEGREWARKNQGRSMLKSSHNSLLPTVEVGAAALEVRHIQSEQRHLQGGLVGEKSKTEPIKKTITNSLFFSDLMDIRQSLRNEELARMVAGASPVTVLGHVKTTSYADSVTLGIIKKKITTDLSKFMERLEAKLHKKIPPERCERNYRPFKFERGTSLPEEESTHQREGPLEIIPHRNMSKSSPFEENTFESQSRAHKIIEETAKLVDISAVAPEVPPLIFSSGAKL